MTISCCSICWWYNGIMYIIQIHVWTCQIIPDRHWIYIAMKRENIKSVFLFLIVCTSCLLISAGILNLVKYKFISKWQCYLQKIQTIFIQTNDLSILDEECVDTKSETKCKKIKKQRRCGKDFTKTVCRLTCGVCTPAGNIYVFGSSKLCQFDTI